MNRLLTFILITIFGVYSGQSQELKSKSTRKGGTIEKYFVLKKEKNVKHGEYLKYRIGPLEQKILIEAGYYNHNKKTGNWYYFYNQGSLKETGNYREGQKEGEWIIYYRKESSGSFDNIIGIEHSARIDSNSNLVVKTSDLQISANGVYQKDMKVGVWNYFSEKGSINQSMNHTTNILELNNVSESRNTYCSFLGGIDRFMSTFSDYRQEYFLSNNMSFNRDEYIFKISMQNESFKIILENSSEQSMLQDGMFSILNSMPADWNKHLLSDEINVIFLIVKLGEVNGYGSMEFSFVNKTNANNK